MYNSLNLYKPKYSIIIPKILIKAINLTQSYYLNGQNSMIELIDIVSKSYQLGQSILSRNSQVSLDKFLLRVENWSEKSSFELGTVPIFS